MGSDFAWIRLVYYSSLLRVNWDFFVQPVRGPVLTFQTTGKQNISGKASLLSMFLIFKLIPLMHSKELMRTLVVDGNFTADHLRQKHARLHSDLIDRRIRVTIVSRPLPRPTQDILFSKTLQELLVMPAADMAVLSQRVSSISKKGNAKPMSTGAWLNVYKG